jgi:protein-L-isoaspartate(D-aspartate) O-methyltransferase
MGFNNVHVLVGDGLVGDPPRAPFDRIVLTAAAERIPETLLDQLADDGVMLVPLGPHAGPQYIVKLHKTKDDVSRETLIPVRFVPVLPGQAQEL